MTNDIQFHIPSVPKKKLKIDLLSSLVCPKKKKSLISKKCKATNLKKFDLSNETIFWGWREYFINCIGHVLIIKGILKRNQGHYSLHPTHSVSSVNHKTGKKINT